MLYAPRVVLVCWGAVALWLLLRWRGRGWRSPLGVTLLGLAGSAVLAGALAAAQLLPVIEFTQQTSRAAGEGPHDIYPFSVEPFRLVELVWPSVFGTTFGRNAYWIEAFRLPGVRQKIWVPSLYSGCLSLVLAAGAMTFRRAPALRVWLSSIVLVSLVGSLGQYTSPIWATRVLAATTKTQGSRHRPLDTNDSHADPPGSVPQGWRRQHLLVDDDGASRLSPVPLSRQAVHVLEFGIAALAGMGWDCLASGRKRERAGPGLDAAGWPASVFWRLCLCSARRS